MHHEVTNGDHTRNLFAPGVATMTGHVLYVTAAYAVSALAIIGLVTWIFFDQRARRRELAELEASGARRRSDRGGSSA
jgi:heme exporter protein D